MDGIETETDGILTYMGEKGKNVQSKPAEVTDYEEYFAEQLTKAQYIVHLSMARHVSKAYENALEASKTFDNVVVVDTGHLSSGMGLMVLKAAEYAADGANADTVVKEIERMKARVRTSFIVGSTEYLERAGRLSSKVNALCEALMLHPVIVLKNSSMKVGAIRIGTKDYTWKQYIDSSLNSSGEIEHKLLFITHAGLTEEELEEIQKIVKRKVCFETVIFQKASPAISTNCGPGTFGLLFMMK